MIIEEKIHQDSKNGLSDAQIAEKHNLTISKVRATLQTTKRKSYESN